jgi:hypothetical protein
MSLLMPGVECYDLYVKYPPQAQPGTERWRGREDIGRGEGGEMT